MEHDGDPHTLILDELGVCEGQCRADMAVINGSLSGFEIKSDKDTLTRLPDQVTAYDRVFDFMTLVVGIKHADAIAEVIPSRWRVLLATESDGVVRLDETRAGAENPETDDFAVAQLLWRHEALALLEKHDLAKGLRSKPRRMLWQALAGNLPAADLRYEVRVQLRARQGWRVDTQPLPGGGQHLPSAT